MLVGESITFYKEKPTDWSQLSSRKHVYSVNVFNSLLVVLSLFVIVLFCSFVAFSFFPTPSVFTAFPEIPYVSRKCEDLLFSFLLMSTCGNKETVHKFQCTLIALSLFLFKRRRCMYWKGRLLVYTGGRGKKKRAGPLSKEGLMEQNS